MRLGLASPDLGPFLSLCFASVKKGDLQAVLLQLGGIGMHHDLASTGVSAGHPSDLLSLAHGVIAAANGIHDTKRLEVR